MPFPEISPEFPECGRYTGPFSAQEHAVIFFFTHVTVFVYVQVCADLWAVSFQKTFHGSATDEVYGRDRTAHGTCTK